MTSQCVLIDVPSDALDGPELVLFRGQDLVQGPWFSSVQENRESCSILNSFIHFAEVYYLLACLTAKRCCFHMVSAVLRCCEEEITGLYRIACVLVSGQMVVGMGPPAKPRS